MIKINEIKLQPYSVRGLAMSFPVVFARDNNLSSGDLVKVYRTKADGLDLLILSKNDLPDTLKLNSDGNINISESKNLVDSKPTN